MCSPQGKPLDSWDIEDVYCFVEAHFSVEVPVKFKGTVPAFVYILATPFSCHFVISMIVFINLSHKMVLSIYPYAGRTNVISIKKFQFTLKAAYL